MNFKDIYDVKIPVNGVNRAVERIRDLNGNILWEVPRINVNFRDNIPINVSYDIANSEILTYAISPTQLTVTAPTIPVKYIYLTKCGTLNTVNDILTNFSTTSFAYNSDIYNISNSKDFELVIKFTTSNNVSSGLTIFSMYNDYATRGYGIECRLQLGRIYLYHYHASSICYNNYASLVVIKPNTTYWIKLSTQTSTKNRINVFLSQDGINYSSTRTFASSYVNHLFGRNYMLYFGVRNAYMYYNHRYYYYRNYIGILNYDPSRWHAQLPFTGSIDLTQSYVFHNSTKWLFNIVDNDYITLINDGNLTTTDQVLQGFTNKKYAHTPIYINWNNTNETSIVLKIKTGDNISSRQEIFGMETTDNFELEILNEKFHWELTNTYSSKIKPNTEYIIEFNKIKTAYRIYIHSTDNTFKTTITANSTRQCNNLHLYFGVDKLSNGIEPFNGSIDLKYSHIVYNNKTYNLRI